MITQQETAKVVGFLGNLLSGAADLGFAALPLVALYQKAKADKVPFADLLVQDPGAMQTILQALERQARSLPPAVLDALQEVIREAKEGK